MEHTKTEPTQRHAEPIQQAAAAPEEEYVREQAPGTLVRAALGGGMPPTPRNVFQLQRTLGNQGTIRLLRPHLAGNRAMQRRVATDLEREAWLALFPHYLPQVFLNHYMDDVGTDLVLSLQEMRDCNPQFSVQSARNFVDVLAPMYDTGGGVAPLEGSGPGLCLTNGTLGNFTVNYHGTLAMDGYSHWVFVGTVDFYDFWDFDPRAFGSGGRPIPAELRVRAANMLLPGRPFHVRSIQMPVWQERGMYHAEFGAPPQSVIDPVSSLMGYGAADVETDTP